MSDDVRLERGAQQLAQAVDHLVDAHHVIVDVAEVGVSVGGHHAEVELHQPVAHLDERQHRALERHQVALEAINIARRVARALLGEDLVLELLEVVLQRLHHREVLVDDEVHQRIKHEARPLGEERGRPLAARPQPLVGRQRAVADRHQVVVPDEDVRLAELQLARRVALHRTQHDEQRLLVLLELRPLMRAVRVLDREVMQPERPLHLLQQLLARLVEPEPHELVRRRHHDPEVLDLHRCHPLAPAVSSAGDDAGGDVRRRSRQGGGVGEALGGHDSAGLRVAPNLPHRRLDGARIRWRPAPLRVQRGSGGRTRSAGVARIGGPSSRPRHGRSRSSTVRMCSVPRRSAVAITALSASPRSRSR